MILLVYLSECMLTLSCLSQHSGLHVGKPALFRLTQLTALSLFLFITRIFLSTSELSDRLWNIERKLILPWVNLILMLCFVWLDSVKRRTNIVFQERSSNSWLFLITSKQSLYLKQSSKSGHIFLISVMAASTTMHIKMNSYEWGKGFPSAYYWISFLMWAAFAIIEYLLTWILFMPIFSDIKGKLNRTVLYGWSFYYSYGTFMFFYNLWGDFAFLNELRNWVAVDPHSLWYSKYISVELAILYAFPYFSIISVHIIFLYNYLASHAIKNNKIT